MYLYLLKYDILLFSFLLGSNLAFLFSLPFGHVFHSENSVDISLQVVIDHDVSYGSNHKGPDTNAFRKKHFGDEYFSVFRTFQPWSFRTLMVWILIFRS